MTRNFHAVNTQYNALYNGNMALDQGQRLLAQNYIDDFWEVLPVERVQLAKYGRMPGEDENEDFARAEAKAVKPVQKHSIEIQGKEHNPQIDEAYMLLGKARYFDSRFIPAMEAFTYILNKYPTSNSINTAKIWKEKTNIRLQNEEVAIKSLKVLFEKSELSDEEFADASAMMGQAYINLEHYDSAVVHIKDAARLVKDKEQKGRLLYIKGQLYNRISEKDSANMAFDEVIALNRNTKRAYMINAEIEKAKNFDYETGDKQLLLEHLIELSENRENRPFLGIIYHQLGNFYIEQDSIDSAVAYYNKSIKRGKDNQKLQSINYSTMGNIYFDRASYRDAGAYYDSTLMYMEENTIAHRRIQKKRDNLDDVIKYEDLAQVNDSIIRLMAMNEDERRAYFVTYTDKLKEEAIADSIAKVKEEKKFRDNEFFKEKEQGNKSGGTFYFYNPANVAQGKLQFERRWGNRSLEDDWRRSDKASVNQEIIAAEDEKSEGGSILDNPKFDPETYLAQLPQTQQAVDSVVQERDMAYYQLGIIYQEKFKEYQLAADRLEKLLTFEPEERLVLPTKYYLYKLYGILENGIYEKKYRDDIVTNYPDSRYAEIVLNPEANIATDASSPEYKYRQLYDEFMSENYEDVIVKAEEYINTFTGQDIVPKFELLKATAIGRVEGLAAYKEALNYVSLSYPNTEEGIQAQRIYSRTIPALEKFNFEENNTSDKWKLLFEFDTASLEEAKALQEKIDKALEEKKYLFLKTSIDFYTRDKMFLVVHGFSAKETARGLAALLREDKEYKIKKVSYEISSPNYTVVQMHKNFDKYSQEYFN